MKTLIPLLVNTLSFGFCSSSRPIWYCRPEQPPPTTRMRRAYLSCISGGVSSRICVAAASVIVIILILLPSQVASQDPRKLVFLLKEQRVLPVPRDTVLTSHDMGPVNVPYIRR